MQANGRMDGGHRPRRDTPAPKNGTKRRAAAIGAAVAVAGFLAAGASTYYSNLGAKADADRVDEHEERIRDLEESAARHGERYRSIDARLERIEEAVQ